MKLLKLLVVTLSVAMLMAVSACSGVEVDGVGDEDGGIVNYGLNPPYSSPQLVGDLSCLRLSKRFQGDAANRVKKIDEVKEISFDRFRHLKCSGLAEWNTGNRDMVTFQVRIVSFIAQDLSGLDPCVDAPTSSFRNYGDGTRWGCLKFEHEFELKKMNDGP